MKEACSVTGRASFFAPAVQKKRFSLSFQKTLINFAPHFANITFKDYH